MSGNASNISNEFKFFHNAETKLYIECANEKNDSIFNSIYNAFFSELKEKLIDIKNDDKESRNNLNNIFAFVGERGAGKTSCMQSIAKMLDENQREPVLGVDKTKFSVLESIDPSFFDETTNILDIILGRLFSMFKAKWESGNQNQIIEKNDLLESFEKVKQTISFMSAKKLGNGNLLCEEDNVDRLLNLGASVNLKKDIQELIQRYLKFFDRDILVIPIDDIDLHSSCAFEMVELIRKYFIQYNVVILMALKIEQLDKVIESTYLKQFSNLLPKDMLSCDQIAKMANKYLIKLIPDNQRFVLPTIEVMYNRVVDIYEKTNLKTNETIEFLNQKWKKDEKVSGYPARYIILKLIFDKTRYLFYHMQGATSLIIPHTLREYNQLLELLLSMPNYKECDSALERQYNKDLFKQYFVQSWCRSNLNERDCQFIKQLFEILDPSIINKIIVQKLSKRFKIFFEEKTDEVEKIIDEKNKSYNVSVGDVNLLLLLIKGSLIQLEDKAFIFAIETFYSMRLYEYYDFKTENDLQRKTAEIEKKVVVKSVLDELREYDVLVGGALFNLKGDDEGVIRKNQDEKRRRDCRIISLKIIRNILDPLLLKEKIDESEMPLFRLVEFFALFISRRQYVQKEEYDDRLNVYRTKESVVYASDFDKNQKYVWFDLLSFFSNLSNVKRSYNRINKNLFDIAKKMDGSLYKWMLDYCKENRPHAHYNEEHPLLSYCTIRNMEVLNDFYNHVKMMQIKSSADNRECLIDFFKGVQLYCIKSYDEMPKNNEGGDKDWYQIDFKFVEIFIKVLEDELIKDKFIEIFKSSENEDEVVIQNAFSSILDSVNSNSDTDLKNSMMNAVPSFISSVKEGNLNNIDAQKFLLNLLEAIVNKEKNTKKVSRVKKKIMVNFPPSWEINEDLNKQFIKSRFYSTDDVRKIIRTELRKQELLTNPITRWITKNIRNATDVWNNQEIESIIGKLIGHIKLLQEKNK